MITIAMHYKKQLLNNYTNLKTIIIIIITITPVMMMMMMLLLVIAKTIQPIHLRSENWALEKRTHLSKLSFRLSLLFLYTLMFKS